jgi:imidazolonepropionase-like amidohydrolase
MRHLAFALLGLLPAALGASEVVPAAPRSAPLLLTNAEVHTVSGAILADHDVLVGVDGRIAAIGQDLATPAGAEVVDLTGQQLAPAFIALSTTLGLVEIEAARATVDHTELGDLTPEAAAHIAFNPDSELLPTIRRTGIAIVQSTPTGGRRGGLVKGRPAVLRLDGWTKEDAALRLTWGQYVRWPAAGVRTGWWAPPEAEQREAMARERDALERFFDQASTYHAARNANPGLAVDVRLEAMRPVVSGAEPIFVRADDYRQISEALAFTQRRGLRLVVVGGEEAPAVAARLVERKVPVVVSVHEVSNRDDDGFDDPYTLPARLRAAGVDVAITKIGAYWDARNVPFTAGHAVGSGLSRADALRAITLTPAEILGVADRVGSIEVGKEATLVAGRGDFLDPLRQDITLLLINGRVVDRDTRQERLERKYAERIGRAVQP